MKFTLSWLKEFLDTDVSLELIAQSLTKIGLEVEEIIDKTTTLSPFIVAFIKEATIHPEADGLKICQVDTGAEILQIVCGGKNARAGIKVVLAKEGVEIPGSGLKIKKTKIRNVESNGMLCSSEELQITPRLNDVPHGIIELADDAVIGDRAVKYLNCDDPVIHIAITPNRGDCLGVYGIARDLAALKIGVLKDIVIKEIPAEFKSPVNVTISDQENCPKFISRYFKNVTNVESPAWLKDRLIAIGKTPISALVDITNYISLTYGRPLHVFDADKIGTELVIRKAEEGENFLALNDKEYKAAGFETIISALGKIEGFAGVIGGKNSSVSLDTKNVLLEVAFFNADQTAKMGRCHYIDTDARYRFDRNVDPLFLETGEKLASKMIIEICGGQLSEVMTTGEIEYKENIIAFPFVLIEQISGIKIAEDIILEILTSLGFKIVNKNSYEIEVKVPSWRYKDVTIKQDLAEEILRIYGYDNIQDVRISTTIAPQILTGIDLFKGRIRRSLVNSGYHEVVTWSFVNSNLAKNFAELKNDLFLANPISSELDYMRPSIIPNLLLAINKNLARGFTNFSLFELGPIFTSTDPEGDVPVVAGIVIGKEGDKNHYKKPRDLDMYDVKADIYAFLEECNFSPENIALETKNIPTYFHPAKSAALTLGKTIIGFMGEIHPLVLREFDIATKVMAFEIFLHSIPQAKIKKIKRLSPTYSDLQIVERDFSFVLEADIPASNVIRAVSSVDRKLIKEVKIFDVYAGSNIEEGKKSIAISVKIEPQEKTLTDQEIEALSQKIIENVGKITGGYIRA